MKKILGIALATVIFWLGGISVNAADLEDTFNAKYYADKYADLKAAFGDDLVAAAKHYIEYGYNESRTQIQKPAPVPSVPTTTTVVD
ncbi:MAG: hypothetical protein IKJ15_03190, partial [Lachnospiraceae bacterium]|nr:hypothetical protein [Lachnospiraceae bacterium]